MTTEQHPDSLAAMKASFRADLEQAQADREAAGPARRRRVRVLRVAGGASVAALAASVAVLALGVGGGPAERLDVAAAAEAALAPKPGIQHLRLRISTDYRVDGKPMEFAEGQGPPEGSALLERWATEETGNHRSTTTSPGQPGKPAETFMDARRNGPTGKRDDVAKTYVSRDNSMEIITRIPKGLRKYDTGGVHWGAYGKETRLEDLRTMLGEGKLADLGPVDVQGRPTRRLVGEEKYPDSPPQTFEFYVDAATFKPVRVVQVSRMWFDSEKRDDSKLQTTTTTIDFEVYEHLPATPETEALLDFNPPAGTETTSRRYRENPRDAKKRHEEQGFDPEEISTAGAATLTK